MKKRKKLKGESFSPEISTEKKLRVATLIWFAVKQ